MIFQEIKGYRNKYLISDLGCVYSIKRNIFLKLQTNRYGYLYVDLCKNGKRKHFTIHRLLANAFIFNPDNKPEVNHKDGNKLNNCIENLEWCTPLENTLHAHKNGFIKILYGENTSNHKLNENQVMQIHGMYMGGLSTIKLGRIFNVSHTTIVKIISGKHWNFEKRVIV